MMCLFVLYKLTDLLSDWLIEKYISMYTIK